MGIGTNLFVGCGGSGIRTLMRLNELLSEDLYWRRQVDEQIYYLLIDTDVDVFDTFDSIVGRQLRGASPPRTVRVRLAQGVDNLQPLANKHFIRPFAVEGDRDAEQRLYDHWWAERRLRPYTAPDVKPLSKGAGQCPPAAYFLTWWNMREIDRAFDSIMREVIVRRGVESLERMNFCVVSSLAGGTGRGCWKLVAFKVRQLFLRHNKVPAPVAFLFDSSVFRDLMESYPEQRLAMTINSLTGFSELSCWVKNVYGRGRSGCPPIMYNLPDMEDPGKPAMDVLTVSIDLDQTAAAPVDNAVLVFEQSPVAVLADHAQYYEMVGNALYAALTQSVIESEKINQAEPYLGVSAATFEVSAATLNDYFEGLARICAIEALLHRTEGAP
ncbi:MAG: hypothetical protein FJ151_04855, partial [Euryarchaeota archaeon]|nr:hypothetical protein [Euryarchaeota archaeon]